MNVLYLPLIDELVEIFPDSGENIIARIVGNLPSAEWKEVFICVIALGEVDCKRAKCMIYLVFNYYEPKDWKQVLCLEFP